MTRPEFKTKVRVTDGMREGRTLVCWELEIECAEWGIASFWPYVPDQSVTVTWQDRDADDNETETEETVELRECAVRFRVLEDVVIPDELEHKRSGKWTLLF